MPDVVRLRVVEHQVARVVQPAQPVARVRAGQSQVVRLVGVDVVGPRGPAGPAGAATVVRVAGANVSGHKVVVADVDGEVVHADPSNPAHLLRVFGLTTQAAVQGANVEVLYLGRLVEPTWSWTPDEPLFLGANGALTHVAPSAPNFLVQVAVAETPTSIFFDPRIPIQQ